MEHQTNQKLLMQKESLEEALAAPLFALQLLRNSTSLSVEERVLLEEVIARLRDLSKGY